MVDKGEREGEREGVLGEIIRGKRCVAALGEGDRQGQRRYEIMGCADILTLAESDFLLSKLLQAVKGERERQR